MSIIRQRPNDDTAKMAAAATMEIEMPGRGPVAPFERVPIFRETVESCGARGGRLFDFRMHLLDAVGEVPLAAPLAADTDDGHLRVLALPDGRTEIRVAIDPDVEAHLYFGQSSIHQASANYVLSGACAVVDQRQRIIQTTEDMTRAMALCPTMNIESGRWFELTQSWVRRRLSGKTSVGVEVWTDARPQEIILPDRHGRPRVMIVPRPILMGASERGLMLHASMIGGVDDISAALVTAWMLRDRDMSILIGLLNGETLQEISRRIGLSPGATRRLLDVILQRTGTWTLGNLLRRIAFA